MSKLTKHIIECCDKLSRSDRTLKDIYDIIYSHRENPMAEYFEGIKKVEYTYGDAKRDIDTVAKAIVSETGKTDSYIGLYGDNSVEWIVLFWAILKSGNKPYLINLRQPVEFTTGILNTLEVEYVLCRESAPDFGRKSFSYKELMDKGSAVAEDIDVPFGGEFAISTNGTTLKEKVCIYSGEELSAQIVNIKKMYKANPDLVGTYKGRQKQLAFLPLYHIFGFEAMYLWYAFWGATFVFLREMSPEAILHTVRKHQVTHIFAVPLLWNAVEKSIRRNISSQDAKTQKKFEKAYKISIKVQSVFPSLGRKLACVLFKEVRGRLFGDSIRFCISGGSSIKSSTLGLMNALGYSLSNGYGMTEIGITSVELTRKVSERTKASIGIPFGSVEYRIGEDSKLFVAGSSLCKSIIVDGKLQENTDWFDTGDVMHSDKRGAYYISGRISDVVFSDDGENLNPDFAEEAFSLPDVIACSVLGSSDNSKLMLVVQIDENLLSVQRNRLIKTIEECNRTLPTSYQVKEIRYTYDPIMDEMAIKVSRSYLRKAIAEGKVVLRSFADYRLDEAVEDTEVRVILREIFCSVLSKKQEDITDHGHFMNDLGGSSLDYFTLISRIDKRFGVTLGFESQQFGYCINDFERIIKEMLN